MCFFYDLIKGGDQFILMLDDYQMISLLVVVIFIEIGQYCWRDLKVWSI